MSSNLNKSSNDIKVFSQQSWEQIAKALNDLKVIKGQNWFIMAHKGLDQLVVEGVTASKLVALMWANNDNHVIYRFEGKLAA